MITPESLRPATPDFDNVSLWGDAVQALTRGRVALGGLRDAPGKARKGMKRTLTQQQIAEIETILETGDVEAKYIVASVDNVAALCSTINVLREENETLRTETSELRDELRMPERD